MSCVNLAVAILLRSAVLMATISRHAMLDSKTCIVGTLSTGTKVGMCYIDMSWAMRVLVRLLNEEGRCSRL